MIILFVYELDSIIIFDLTDAKGHTIYVQMFLKTAQIIACTDFCIWKAGRLDVWGWAGGAGSRGVDSAGLRVGLLPAPSQSPRPPSFKHPEVWLSFYPCLPSAARYSARQFPLVKFELVGKVTEDFTMESDKLSSEKVKDFGSTKDALWVGSLSALLFLFQNPTIMY